METFPDTTLNHLYFFVKCSKTPNFTPMKPHLKTLLLLAALLVVFAKPVAGQSYYPLLRSLNSLELEMTPMRDASSGLWGYANRGGYLIPPEFEEAGKFETLTATDGTKMRVAKIKFDGCWGYVTCEGMYLITPKYDSISDFKNDIAIGRSNDSYSIICLKSIMSPRYGKKILVTAIIQSNLSGITPITEANRYIAISNSQAGVLSEKGEWLIKPEYDKIIVDNNTFRLESGGKKGFADKNGRIAIPCIYDSITSLDNGSFLVKAGNKYGVYSHDFRHILQDTYDDIKWYSNLNYIIKNNSLCGRADENGTIMYPCIFSVVPDRSNCGYVELMDADEMKIFVKGDKEYSVTEYDEMLFRRMGYNDYSKTTLLPDWLKKHLVRERINTDKLIVHYLFRSWANNKYVLIADGDGVHQLVGQTLDLYGTDGAKKVRFVLALQSQDSSDNIVPYKLDEYDNSGGFIKTLGYGYIGVKCQFFTQPIFSKADSAHNGIYNIIYPDWGSSVMGVSFETLQDMDSYHCDDHKYIEQ